MDMALREKKELPQHHHLDVVKRYLNMSAQQSKGYIIVGRSITPAEDDDKKSVIRSEMLLSVIIIRRLHENNKEGTRNTVTVSDSGRVAPRRDLRNRCLMITLSHIKSPLIPKVLSKQVGLSAAKSFFMDIRGCK